MASNSALILPPPSSPSVATTNDIRGLKPPVEIPSGWAWLWWTLGALALIVALVLLWRWWMKKQQATPPFIPVPPHVRAKQRLAEALRLIAEPMPFCVAVSNTVRVYLEERFQLRAPERTTEEFLHDLRSTAHLNSEQKQSLAGFLESCDLVKFARFEPNEAALRELHDSAGRLVDETQFEPVAAVPTIAAAPPPPPPPSPTPSSTVVPPPPPPPKPQ